MTYPIKPRRAGTPTALYDRWFLIAAVGLLLIGLLMVASSSITIADKQYHHSFYYLTRQGIYLLIGLIAALGILRLPIVFWQKISSFLLLISLLLLILVLIPGIGHAVNGSMRWIVLGPLRLQVSEVAKFTLVLYLAAYIHRHQEAVQQEMMGFIKPLLIVGITAVILLKEPDFGASVVILLTVLGMLFLAGVRLSHFLTLVAVALGAVAILAISSPYRLARLTTFLDPWANQYSGGYQLTQSLIAFGRGSWYGVGLGESIQKLFYLPEAHTDFLFAVLAEEFGLVGTTLVISLFLLLVYRALAIGRRALALGNVFAGYTAYGFGLLLGIQAMINIGVNAGILPTKGLTLPLMSYGGSSMLINCVILAIVMRIDFETRHGKIPLVNSRRK